MHRSILLVFFACALTAAPQDSPKLELTARELFYSAQQPPKTAASAPKQAAPTPAPTPAPAAKKPSPPSTPPPSPVANVDVPRPPAQQPPSAPQAQPVDRTDGGTVIKASLVTAPPPATGTPLGLKFTILRLAEDEKMVEVAPDTIFHTHDKLQLSVQTNGPGYLYIVAQGSSGTWQPVFPSPDVADGDNHVTGWNANLLPTGTLMVLDDQVGTEKLFIVFSRTPQDSLEKMIYSLQGVHAQPAGERAESKPPEPKKYVMSASAEIPDSEVGDLRANTRDLIFEKVSEKTPADKSPSKQENATYVVNKTGSPDSRVVADVTLVHQ